MTGELGAAGVQNGATKAAQLDPLGASNSKEDRLDRIVREAAERHNVDPALVKAVITTESGWNPQAVSRKGAVGLMQLIPQTAQRFGVNNSFDPAQNVDLPKSLAAYNAGERAVDLSGGIPDYRETRMYVQKVTDNYFRPGSGRDPNLWSPPRRPVRQETESNGRVVFTNQ
jgi:soluble lytic murein transglycosylase-like protein